MKAVVLFTVLLMLFVSCSKNNDIDPVLSKTFDSLSIKAYRSTYMNNIEGVDYLAFTPSDSLAFAAINLDDNGDADCIIRVSSSVYSQSPHSMLQQYGVGIEAVDTNAFAIAKMDASVWAGVKTFQVGSAINANCYFSNEATIDVVSAYSTITNRGNLYLGIRKKIGQNEFRYGYLNLYVDMAQVTILSSKLRNDGADCIVE